MRARTIASVTGSRITNDVPLPSTVRISIDPPSARMRVTATSIPTPRPDTLVTASAVENPGPAEHAQQLIVGQRLGVRFHDAIPLGALEDTLAVDPAPVVAHADRHAGPLAHRRQYDLRFGLLPATPPLGLGLDAVVHRVPQQVQQRVAELVQDRAVELDFLALDPERDLLAELAGQVTHQTGEPVEHLPHRRHARLDDFRLQLARQPRDLNRDIVDRRVSGVGRELVQAAAHGDELADQIHEAVEPPEVHADVPALRLGSGGGGGGPRGGGAPLSPPPGVGSGEDTAGLPSP